MSRSKTHKVLIEVTFPDRCFEAQARERIQLALTAGKDTLNEYQQIDWTRVMNFEQAKAATVRAVRAQNARAT